MLTKEQEVNHVWIARAMGYIATATFLVAILMLCESEFFLIQKLWIKADASFNLFSAITIPFVVFVPGLCSMSLSLTIRRLGKNGSLGPVIIAQLRFSLALLLMMAYSAIMLLVSQSVDFR